MSMKLATSRMTLTPNTPTDKIVDIARLRFEYVNTNNAIQEYLRVEG